MSIPDQIKTCRQDGHNRGWIETGVYKVLGQSRTRWVNLRDAENGITNPDGSHPLRDMLDAAQRGEFDILICYHYNRFRNLDDQIAETLKGYGVQVTSHSQWTEPQSPDHYEPLSDISGTIRTFTGIASRAEITELKRRYQKGMPARISKGLPKGKPPFGYRKPEGHQFDRKAIPVQEPAKIAIVRKIKDLFLAGKSLPQIAAQLNQDGFKTPTGKPWRERNVSLILRNPFYAGIVWFGRERRMVDIRTGNVRVVAGDPEKITYGTGAHKPLWDLSTHRAIEAEFERRGGRRYAGIRTQRLSHLLYCGICGARVWVEYHGGHYSDHRRVWACSKDEFPRHVRRKDPELIQTVSDELIKAIKTATGIKLPSLKAQRETSASLEDLRKRKDRLVDALEDGTLDKVTYAQRVKTIDEQISTLRKKQDEARHATEIAEVRMELLHNLAAIIDKTPNYILRAPAQDVNTQLNQLIKRILIWPGRKIKIEFR